MINDCVGTPMPIKKYMKKKRLNRKSYLAKAYAAAEEKPTIPRTESTETKRVLKYKRVKFPVVHASLIFEKSILVGSPKGLLITSVFGLRAV